MMTTQSITSGQRKQYFRFIEDAAERALTEVNPDKDGIQRIIEHGDEFASIVRSAAAGALKDLSVSDKFYLSGYREPVEVSDQIDILRSHWPTLNPDGAIRYMQEVYPSLQLPNWIEGSFALIRPGFFSDNYGEELEEVLKALAKDRKGKFHNYREGQLGPDHLRQNAQTLSMMNQIVERQSGSDIIIVPEQFGIRHRGCSVRRAREVFVVSEFGEGAKNVGTMILTNPIRLQHYDDFWIDCPGDEYAPDADGFFSNAPYFYFSFGKVEFDSNRVDNFFDYYGSLSGFLPKSLQKLQEVSIMDAFCFISAELSVSILQAFCLFHQLFPVKEHIFCYQLLLFLYKDARILLRNLV